MKYSKSDSMEILRLDDTVTPYLSRPLSYSLSVSLPLFLSLPILTCSL